MDYYDKEDDLLEKINYSVAE